MERIRNPAPIGTARQRAGATAARTTMLLIRHAHTEAVGQRLVGRMSGVALSPEGRVQAERLGRALAVGRLAAIYTSPLERAIETARAIARYQAALVHLCDALTEIDFGDWTGKTFEELDALPEWRTFNDARSTARVPNGEDPCAAQHRAVAALAEIAARHPAATVAVVSHADVLRSAVLHFAGTPLDLCHRFEISPASVTGLEWSAAAPRLLYVNSLLHLAHLGQTLDGPPAV